MRPSPAVAFAGAGGSLVAPMTEPGPAPAPSYVQVALNLPLRREFTYALPAGLAAAPGNRVLVDFHGRKLGGVSRHSGSGKFAESDDRIQRFAGSRQPLAASDRTHH